MPAEVIAGKGGANRGGETQCLMIVKIEPIQVLIAQHHASVSGYDDASRRISVVIHVQAHI